MRTILSIVGVGGGGGGSTGVLTVGEFITSLLATDGGAGGTSIDNND